MRISLKRIWRKYRMAGLFVNKNKSYSNLSRADKVAVGYIKNLKHNRTLRVVGRGTIVQDVTEIRKSPNYINASKLAKKHFHK